MCHAHLSEKAALTISLIKLSCWGCLKVSSCLRRSPAMSQARETNWFTNSLVAEDHNSWGGLFFFSWFIQIKMIKRTANSCASLSYIGYVLLWLLWQDCNHHLSSQRFFLISVKCGSQSLVLTISNSTHRIFFQNIKAIFFHNARNPNLVN